MSDSGEVVSCVFRPEHQRFEQTDRILTFGGYLGVDRLLDAHGAIRYAREGNQTGYLASEMRDMSEAVRWTRWINALNAGRKWPLERLFARFDPVLGEGIALVVIPSHDPLVTNPPIRELARRLAGTHCRIDATGCLVRHTKIKRIVYGGPSYRSLHRQTITVQDSDLFAGRSVLLLDDIARSGASLRACAELLYEAGAARVQKMALGRVV